MADNFLERQFDQYQNHKNAKSSTKKKGLETLLLKNRSYRGYDQSIVVGTSTLEKIVSVNNKIPSGRNQQVLRFKLVTQNTGAQQVLDNIKLGGALPELHLPFAGTEPLAFIIVCSTAPENRIVDIDLGISAQSMLLKAVELGLNGIIIAAFHKQNIKEAFALPYEPLLILAIGKGAEEIRLVEISDHENHNYYRKEEVHYVPKVRISDLIL